MSYSLNNYPQKSVSEKQGNCWYYICNTSAYGGYTFYVYVRNTKKTKILGIFKNSQVFPIFRAKFGRKFNSSGNVPFIYH